MSGIPIGLLVTIFVIAGIIYGIYRYSQAIPPAQTNSVGPSGVAGWLLLLVSGLIVLGPLMGAGQINSDLILAESQYPGLKYVAEWKTYKSVTWWSFLVVASMSIYAGLGLAKTRNPSAVKKAKIILWVAGPGASIAMGIFIPLFIFGEIEANAQFIGSLIGSFLSAAIWTAYLSKSRRVKATYFRSQS